MPDQYFNDVAKFNLFRDIKFKYSYRQNNQKKFMGTMHATIAMVRKWMITEIQ